MCCEKNNTYTDVEVMKSNFLTTGILLNDLMQFLAVLWIKGIKRNCQAVKKPNLP
jgi:hypothetical protein